MNIMSNDNKNFELIIPSLDVIDQILKIIQDLDQGHALNRQKDSDGFRRSIESFNNLYVKISHRLIQDSQTHLIQDDMGQYKLELETFARYNIIIFKILQYQNISSQDLQMPEWLDMLIQSSKTNLTNICLDSVSIFINILRNNDKSNIRGGGALMNIQRLIADPRNKSGKFSDQIMNNPMGFKQEILNELQNSEQQDEEGQKSGHTHCKEIIQNLWQLLEQESDTENIVRHLKEFDMLVPRIFCDVVIEDLRNK